MRVLRAMAPASASAAVAAAVGAVAVASVVSAALAGFAAAPAGAINPLTSAARLQGFFTATGVVTRAVGVPGERVGEHIKRTWAFESTCAAGQCAAVTLVRQRGTHRDQIVLRLTSPGHYAGRGSFGAAVRCGRRTYRAGERARYTITLTIVAAAADQSTTVRATGFTATYDNPRRVGLTPCYTPPSSDKARYLGALISPPAGAIRSESSTRSSTGS